MAIANNGPNGFHRGRIGNVVYYELDGKNVSRTIGTYKDPDTPKQREARLKTKMCSNFLQLVHDFINIGFSTSAKGASLNAYNVAVAYNKPNMFKGSYPDIEIDYEMLTVSKGNLTPAQNPKVIQNDTGLTFSWDTDPKMVYPLTTDQVMMLAVFPKKNKAIYTIFGTERSSGTASLQIPASLRNQHMEIYISFSSANRENIADSTYLGNLNQA